MLLLHDGKLMTSQDPQCTIAHFLLPVCELLNAAHHRAYISIQSVDRAVRCLLTLLQESNSVAEGKCLHFTMNRLSVYRYLTRYCNGLFAFARKELAMLNVCCTNSLARQSQEILASRDLMMDPEDHCQTIIINSAVLPLFYKPLFINISPLDPLNKSGQTQQKSGQTQQQQLPRTAFPGSDVGSKRAESDNYNYKIPFSS